MPKITISEEDLTISNEVETAANVVYIPGITFNDVEDKPTIFTSIVKFKEVYGDTPYKFVSNQVVDGETVVGANEFEKSYVYAVELLGSGIPVSFQNIVSLKDFVSYESGNIINDAGVLQAFYDKLKGIKGTEEGQVTVGDATVGVYNSTNGTWSNENVTFNLSMGSSSGNSNIEIFNVLGVVPFENADSILGLPEGNRFTVKLSNGTALNNDMACTVTVNNGTTTGTTNVYDKSAFESDGSLINVVNVKKSTVITIDVKWSSSKSKTYIFRLLTSNMQKQDGTVPAVSETVYSVYSDILDRWTYNVKYLTTGGYPTVLDTTSDLSLLQTLMKAAAVRGDAIALIDTPYLENIYDSFTNLNTSIDLEASDIYMLRGLDNCNLNYKLSSKRKDESILKYGAVDGSAGIYSTEVVDLIYKDENKEVIDARTNRIVLPGSFGYLLSLANNVEVLKNPDYFAIAGQTRGLVPHLLQLVNETTGAQADAVQVRPDPKTGAGVGTISLNPIVMVQNYGYCIWGNRTMFPNPKKDLAAGSFLNIRVMAADVKKVVYIVCQKLTFETNNIELWLKFKSEVEPTLEKMIADGALEGYELTKLKSEEKATLSVYVKLITTYAVEDFDVTVGLTDSTVEEA